jgi:hypothetical protein
MQKPSRLVLYGGAFLVLASVGFAIGSATRFPTASLERAAEPGNKLAARRDSKAEENAKVTTQDYRYGPEVNHGRSDTPVNAAQQALKQVNEPAPVKSEPRRSYRSRIVGRTGSEMYGH